MNRPLFPLALFAALALSTATVNAGELHFPQHGYTIKPLEGDSGDALQQVLAMYLPAKDGFAANVNVQLQPFAGTMSEYLELSKQQFKAAGVKLIAIKTPSPTSAMLEYAGLMQGANLHFYARAEASRGKIYLVTATARDADWSRVAAKLRDVVDSFKLDDKR